MAEPLNLSRYDAVLIDLDGTFYREEASGARVLPGAVELVRRLQASGQPYACLTNSGASPAQLERRLSEMGAIVTAEHIWSCSAAAAEYVLRRFAHARKPRLFNLSTDGMTDLLEGRVDWVPETEATAPQAGPCDAVLVAGPVNRWATTDRQWAALQLLCRSRHGGTPAALIGLCADRVYPSHRGLEFGSGALTEMLAYASGLRPVYCGKPEEVFFRALCDRLRVRPDRCVLVGDNLDSDVAGAKRVGMTSAAVLTGVATRHDIASADSTRRPDFVFKDLTELLGRPVS